METLKCRQISVYWESKGGNFLPEESSYEHAENTSSGLEATSATGWAFKKWVGEVTNEESEETTVLMDRDKTVKAVFDVQ